MQEIVNPVTDPDFIAGAGPGYLTSPWYLFCNWDLPEDEDGVFLFNKSPTNPNPRPSVLTWDQMIELVMFVAENPDYDMDPNGFEPFFDSLPTTQL